MRNHSQVLFFVGNTAGIRRACARHRRYGDFLAKTALANGSAFLPRRGLLASLTIYCGLRSGCGCSSLALRFPVSAPLPPRVRLWPIALTIPAILWNLSGNPHWSGNSLHNLARRAPRLTAAISAADPVTIHQSRQRRHHIDLGL